jgi:RNA polymerase sigma factor (sigma-70 family)
VQGAMIGSPPIREAASTFATSEDADTVAGFLRGDALAVARVDQWIAGAALPFRRRLAADWPDLLQEARVEILRLFRQSAWRGESRLKTYVWRVVGHTCLDAMRRLGRRPLHEPEDPEAPLASAEPSPLDRVLQQDATRRLLWALEAVPADCRELWGNILRGQSYREISGAMGVSEAALRVRAHRCRKRAIEALGGSEGAALAVEG